MNLNLVLENHFGDEASVIYATEFVDDTGVEIAESSIFPSAELPGDGLKSFPLATPPDLEDGYYTLRVSIAAKSGEAEATHLLEEYFEVDDGKLYAVDLETYFNQSQANMAVTR